MPVVRLKIYRRRGGSWIVLGFEDGFGWPVYHREFDSADALKTFYQF